MATDSLQHQNSIRRGLVKPAGRLKATAQRALHAPFPTIGRARFGWAAMAMAFLLMGGCTNPGPETSGGEAPPALEEAAPEAHEPTAPIEPSDATPDVEAGAAPASLHANIVVVDLQGQPLPGMTPIVTRQPNAFDEPVASGIATDLEGRGSIRFKTGEHLYLRAWDPALRYFPNNFYEVLPGGGRIDDELAIQMVPSVNLEAQLFLPDGTPAREQDVALMLFHPTRGPWWPAEAETDKEGIVQFSSLPAGEFVLRFQVESGARLEHAQTALPPATTINLGVLQLQAQ